jgi:SIR2-like domain
MAMVEHQSHQHIDYVHQCLRQSKAPVGLFLSAGCGVSIKVDGKPLVPDIAGMTDQVRASLETDKKRKESLRALAATFNGAPPNIEELLSRTRALAAVADVGPVHSLTREQLDDLETAISKAISGLINVTLPGGSTPHRSLAAWASAGLRTEPVELFTTNYDLLFEQALEIVGVPYFDGFVGANRPFFDAAALDRDKLPSRWLRLWKLHGSINWRRDSKGSVYRTFVTETESPTLIHPSHLKYDESRKMPYLAMIDQFRGFLRKRRAALVICGFSFGDEHLEDVLLQELEGNPTAAAFALMYGKLEDHGRAVALAEQRPNLSVYARDGAVVGTQKGPWAPDAEEKTTEVDLGDFQALGALLAEMSGRGTDPSDDDA